MMRFLKKLTNKSTRATQRILQEALEEEFEFHVYEGEEKTIALANQIRVLPEKISYKVDGNEVILSYENLRVQVLPKSKVVNLIDETSKLAWLLLATLPLIVSSILLSISIEPSQEPRRPLFQPFFDPYFDSFGITRDEVRGFAIAVLIVSYFAPLILVWNRKRTSEQIAVRAASVAPQLIEKLEEASDVEDYFSRLIQVNLSNMEQYYLLVRTQTDKSYRLTQFSAVIGFSTLLAGILLSFINGLDSPSTLVTISSGALIEFISAIFFYIYNRTVAQLNTYHEKLVNVQDTMLALKVAQIVKDESLKDKTMAYLTQALTSRLINSSGMETATNFFSESANK